MKKILSILLLLTTFITNSQTIIWSEDFESYPDGTQNTVKWTTLANNCDGDGAPGSDFNQNYWGVRTTLGDKEFCCNDIEGLTCCSTSEGDSDNEWNSQNINISGYSNISISINFRATGNMECNSCSQGRDNITSQYRVDGGPWVTFLNICGLGSGQQITECVDITNGSVLNIRILLGTQANDEKYYFDDVFVYEDICSIVLPIELISFNGEHNYKTGVNELNWLTASEANNDRFEIYSSIDGEYWEMIGEVKGAGNSSIEQVYDFTHRPISNLTYYKLKQVDYDGKFEYSNVVSISKQEDKIVSVKYYDMLGKELSSEPSNTIFIKVIEYEYRTEYLRVFKL